MYMQADVCYLVVICIKVKYMSSFKVTILLHRRNHSHKRTNTCQSNQVIQGHQGSSVLRRLPSIYSYITQSYYYVQSNVTASGMSTH